MVQDVLSLLRPNEGRRRGTFAGLSSLLGSSAEPPQPTEPIGIELKQLIDALTRCGRRLGGVAEDRLARHIDEILDHIRAISCRVAVVGQVKAGKSSFINAVMHRGELLPTHVNPWTAVATRLHFGVPGKPLTGCDFTFFTDQEWADLGRKTNAEQGDEFEDGFVEMKSRAEKRLGGKFDNLLGKVHFYQSVQAQTLLNYLCAGPPVDEISREIKPGRYADITKTANVYFPPTPFALPTTLIDTPGINDSTHLRHRITREIIDGADIYIVVLTARHPLAGSDVALLELLRGLEKKRIVVFINRVDELNDRAGATDTIVKHVRSELDKIFEGVSIPIIAGSARWAGLAGSESDMASVYEEIETQAFQAVAAQLSPSITDPGQADDKAAAAREALRTASGIEATGKLLSLFMLSGFISNYARGIAAALTEAAGVPAINAHRQLLGIAEHLRHLASAHGANGSSQQIEEIETLVAKIESMASANRHDCAAAIETGIASLEAALEAEIRNFGGPQQGHAFRRAAIDGSGDAHPARGVPRGNGHNEPVAEPATADQSDWLSTVKGVTVDFLRKTFAESPPPNPVESAPSTTRRASLTVPVTARRDDISIEGGKAWWSEWMAGQNLLSQQGEELNRLVRQTYPQGPDELADGTATENVEAIFARAPDTVDTAFVESLTRLTRIFGAMAEGAGSETDHARNPLASYIAECDGAINHACIAIAVHESVIRQVRALFTPPANPSA